MQQLLQEREAERDREAIQNDMYLNKQRALTNAEHYRCHSATHLSPRPNLALVKAAPRKPGRRNSIIVNDSTSHICNVSI